MNKGIILLGSVAGMLGALVCLVAGLARVSSFYYLAGYQSTTVFNVGIGLMVFACLVKLDTLTSQRRGE